MKCDPYIRFYKVLFIKTNVLGVLYSYPLQVLGDYRSTVCEPFVLFLRKKTNAMLVKGGGGVRPQGETRCCWHAFYICIQVINPRTGR